MKIARRHDIDALRFLVFSLLIVYHTAMLYLAGEHFHLKSSYLSEALHWPMVFINRWRMEIVFLISGVSSAMMSASGRGRFLTGRLRRLLLPLLFGMAVVIPVQPYCEGVANGLVQPGYLEFLAHYFGGHHWPENAFAGWKQGFTWNHLWYLAYLLIYTVLLGALRPLLESRPGRIVSAGFVRLRGWRLLLLPALPPLLATIAFKLDYPETHALLRDWYLHAIYFTMFLYGWWLGKDEAVWKELARLRFHSSLLAIPVFAGYIGFDMIQSENTWSWAVAGSWPLRNLYMWLAIYAILGWGHALLNRPFGWLPWARQAVFPWYILHQSFIIVLAYWLLPLQLGPVLEPLLILAGTVLLCWLTTSLLTGPLRWLRPCFGMVNSRPQAAPAVVKLAA